jgi:hypothetical protein
VNWTTDDLLAIVAAPLSLYAVLRLLHTLAPQVPHWPAGLLVILWIAVLGAFAAPLAFGLTIKAVMVAWMFALVAAIRLTSIWRSAREGEDPRA